MKNSNQLLSGRQLFLTLGLLIFGAACFPARAVPPGSTLLPVKLKDVSGLMPAYDPSLNQAEMDELLKRMEPEQMDDLLSVMDEDHVPAWLRNKDSIAAHADELKTMSFYYVVGFGDYAILYMYSDENTHLPADMRVKDECCIVVHKSALQLP